MADTISISADMLASVQLVFVQVCLSLSLSLSVNIDKYRLFGFALLIVLFPRPTSRVYHVLLTSGEGNFHVLVPKSWSSKIQSLKWTRTESVRLTLVDVAAPDQLLLR